VGGISVENARSVALHRRLGFRVLPSTHPQWPGWVTVLANPCAT
jgi:hypothetical protein